MKDPILGQTPTVSQYSKDAVHVPILCLVTKIPLYPGEKVNIVNGYPVPIKDKYDSYMAIADPFYEDEILKGTKLWFLVKPSLAGNIRHEFDFDADPVPNE